MQNLIHIPIPSELEEPASAFDLVAYFQRFIQKELHPALDTEVWEIDERAYVYETVITDVEIEEDNIHVNYNVLFDAYYGCRNQNYAGEEDRTITGRRQGNNWVFEPNKPRERRNTHDEF
jgi:hypothetical protein